MEQELRNKIADVIFEGSDIGGGTRALAQEKIRTEQSSGTRDAITDIIIDTVITAEDIDDAMNTLNYSIDQLYRAKGKLQDVADEN